MSNFTRKVRIICLLLVLVMLAGMIPSLSGLVTTEAEAIYHEDNAPVASEELLTATENTFFVNGGDSGYRIIDGKLYVWGSNSGYRLGLQTYNGEPVTDTTIVTEPTEVTYTDGVNTGWGNDFKGKVVKVGNDHGALMLCLTDDGSMYYWGTTDSNYWGWPSGWGKTIKEIKKLDMSLVTGANDTIVDYVGGNVGVCAIGKSGKVYCLGNAQYLNPMCGCGTDYKLHPVIDGWEDRFQDHYTYVDGSGDPTDLAQRLTKYGEQAGGNKRRRIEKIVFTGYSYAATYIMSDNTLWATGGNWGYYNYRGDNISNYGSPVRCDQVACNNLWAAAVPQANSLAIVGGVGLTIDASGCVWAQGADNSIIDPDGRYWRLAGGYDQTAYNGQRAGIAPRMIYDSTLTGAKAIRAYVTRTSGAVILTEDNSLYAIGLNKNQYISTSVGEKYPVTQATQIFADLSRQVTITGVHPTYNGVMVVTKSGDQYWAGNNEFATAGNGTTESPEPGEIQQAVPPNLPPVQPLTANELIFEIEDDDGVRYRYDPTQDNTSTPNGCSVTRIEKNGQETHLTRVELNAGTIYKLNIYFNDFGRLNGWEIPIRFDPTYIKIVRSDGEPYDATKVVTPGAIGTSTGIIKCFTDSQWSGGQMVGNLVKQGGYPKICNGEGWVSIAGFTEDKTAKINGEVKMASILFTPVGRMNANAAEYFTIANKYNNTCGKGVTGLGYDDAMTAGDFGACWIVTSLLEDGVAGVFDFNYTHAYSIDSENKGDMVTPAFNATITDMTNLDLTIKSADGQALKPDFYRFVRKPDPDNPKQPLPDATDPSKAAEGSYSDYNTIAQVSYDNDTAIYTVETIVSPNKTAGRAASFPQVNWEVVVAQLPDGESVNNEKTEDSSSGDGAAQTGYNYADFITIVSTDTSSLKFKINEDYPGATVGSGDDAKTYKMPCILKFIATAQRSQGAYGTPTKEILLALRSFEPPTSIEITQHQYLTDDTLIYTSITDESKDPELLRTYGRTFTADFPDAQMGDDTAVLWTLLDSNHNLMTNLSTDYASLDNPQPSNAGYGMSVQEDGKTSEAYTPPSVHLTLQHTTYGEEFFYLRVESAYDASVYDEIKIKIHQAITSITWKKNSLYLLSDGNGADLSTMISISPDGEYYDSNIEFVHMATPLNDTGNPFMYVDSTTGQVQPITVSKTVAGAMLADQVYVRDTISGISTLAQGEDKGYMKISIISIKSPLKDSDVEVHNLLGTKADYATVYNLEVGDTIIFLDSYEKSSTWAEDLVYGNLTEKLSAYTSTGKYKRFNNLTADQIGNQKMYSFPLPDFLDAKGGELAVIVVRKADKDDANPTVFDRIPVNYISDPSKVYGYVQLFNKSPDSYQNRDITIRLIGPSTPEPIQTTAKGYFVFQEYIIPGEYTMIISKSGYLTRTIQPDTTIGYRGVVITEAAEFAISTYEKPIYLYAGDLDNNGAINSADITNYVRNWYGQVNRDNNIYDFAKYDFYDLDGRNAINMYDLDSVLTHNGWTKSNYSNWNVPTTS